MKKKKKKGPLYSNNKYLRDLQAFVPQYIAETGDQSMTAAKVAEWAIRKGLWEQRVPTAIRQLTRELSRAMKQVYIPGDKGRKVRKYHNFQMGEGQPHLWSPLDKIKPDQMNESKTMRRNNMIGTAVQLDNDLEHYNKYFNPGDPILFDKDFTNDVAEHKHSGEFLDLPPEDDDAPPEDESAQPA